MDAMRTILNGYLKGFEPYQPWLVFLRRRRAFLETTIDKERQSVTIDYDRGAISDESVREVAARLTPRVHRRFDEWVLRLDGRA